MRCSAERPCSPNASRSPRTSRTCLSGVTRASADPLTECSTRPVWQGRSATGAKSGCVDQLERLAVVERVDASAADTSSSAMPVQPVESATGCMRYSSACRPTEAALTRSGMSLVTSVTSRPSAPRFSATARMRESLLSTRKPAGSVDRSEWLSSTCSVPPSSPIGHRRVEPAVRDAQLVEHPQRLPGEPAELGVVPLALQLADDHQRQHDLVLGEPAQRSRIGEQDGGVEDEGAHAGRRRRRGLGAAVTWRS